MCNVSLRSIAVLACLIAAPAGLAFPQGAPDCSWTVCGCLTDVVLEYTTTVLAESRPVRNIEIYCGNEETPLALSDESGVAKFTLSTARSPGCHFAGRTNLTLRDRAKRHKDRRVAIFQANGQVVYWTVDE